jgi:hypothetical protein
LRAEREAAKAKGKGKGKKKGSSHRSAHHSASGVLSALFSFVFTLLKWAVVLAALAALMIYGMKMKRKQDVSPDNLFRTLARSINVPFSEQAKRF